MQHEAFFMIDGLTIQRTHLNIENNKILMESKLNKTFILIWFDWLIAWLLFNVHQAIFQLYSGCEHLFFLTSYFTASNLKNDANMFGLADYHLVC